MRVWEFLDSEQNYLDWLANHPNGYVLNALSPPAEKYLVLHTAQCKSISSAKKGAHPAGFTGNSYFKVCADEVTHLRDWCQTHGFNDFSSYCHHCQPVGPSYPKRLNWTRDELILALDLYFKAPAAHGDDKHPAVVELSELLQDLPIHPQEKRLANFRNPNGVALKLVNFRSLDPTKAGTGMPQGAQKDREIWDEFAHDVELLSATALAIRELYSTFEPSDLASDSDDDGVAEGGILGAAHRRHERNQAVVRKKKNAVFELHMALRCEVCEFDFAATYGELGSRFAECHHTKPVSTMQRGDKTKLNDLSIVCANCHRMLHRRPELLTIAALKKIFDDERAFFAIKSTFIGSTG